jgi:adenosylhomocysteinase
VGESSWVALDLILREAGLSAFGSKFGMIGYGMIGRRVVAAARSGGARTSVFDADPIKLLDARSYKHGVQFSAAEALAQNDIVIASTGGMAVSAQDILHHAKDGLFLGSAGSRVQEIDVAGLDALCTAQRDVHNNLREYTLPNGKKVYLLRKGTSINFLVGSCPDETMDIVFSEVAAGIQRILSEDLPHGSIHEVQDPVRRKIALDWLKLRS